MLSLGHLIYADVKSFYDTTLKLNLLLQVTRRFIENFKTVIISPFNSLLFSFKHFWGDFFVIKEVRFGSTRGWGWIGKGGSGKGIANKEHFVNKGRF